VDPDHIERLAAYKTEVATGVVWFHSGSKKPKVLHKLYEVGLFRTARLREVGGYNPAERLGQDSLTMRMLRITGGLKASTHPTYHRVNRANSLCTSPNTKKGSPARNEMRVRNRAVLARCERLETAERIRAYRETLIPTEIRDELGEHNERLRELL
jgi:hypothetical protein